MTTNRITKLVLPGTASERFEIGQRRITQGFFPPLFTDDPPAMDRNISRSLGFDVQDWQEVYVFNWIDDDDAGYTGAKVSVAPWRFYRFPLPYVDPSGSVGDFPERGLWVVDDDVTMALDASGLTIAQGKIFHTYNADRMFFQIKTYTQGDAEADPDWLKQACVGVTPRSVSGEGVGVGGGGGATGGGGGNVNIVQVDSQPVAAGAGAVTAGTLRITWANDSPGIGDHDDPTADPGFRALGVAYSGAPPAAVADGDDVHLIADESGQLRIAGYDQADDEVKVQFGDNSWGAGSHDVATAVDGLRALFVATDVDPADVANQDDVHPIATLDGRTIIAGYDRLGDLVRIQETDPINFHMAWDLIEETSMGTAGSPYEYYLDLDSYYRMSIQIDITLGSAGAGDVALTIEATVHDDDPDLTARTYIDRTTAITGAGSVTVDDLIEDLNGIYGNYTAVKLVIDVTNASDDSAIRIDTKRFIGG